MSILRIFAFSFLLITLLPCFFVLGSFGVDGEDVAVSTIDSAEDVVVSAYRAVLEAEEAGADVSGFLERLNVAAERLALAQMCSRRGDFDRATDNASLCLEAAEGIVEDAGVLRDRAVLERGVRSWVMIGGSIAGVALAVFGSWFSWRVFKMWYYGRVLKLKPEVSGAES